MQRTKLNNLMASSLFQVGRTEGSWGLSLAALR